MKVSSLLVVSLLCYSLGMAGLQKPEQKPEQKPDPANASPPIQEIIERFAEAESENKKARANYEFTQDYQMEELDATGSVIGGFYRRSDVVYDDKAQPFELIRYYPPPTMPNVRVTNEDMRDALGIQPFALTRDDLPKYQIDYVGREQWAGRSTYVFAVKPRHERSGERYFEGRIWVDAHDRQIVKAAGQAVPETDDQRFPHFETLREKIDGKYWFPVYTSADDVLKFKRSPQAHIKMTIRYSNYKKFTATLCIQGEIEAEKCEEKSAAKAESAARDSDELKKAYKIQEKVRQLSGEKRYREAIPHAESMLALYREALGPTHPYVVAVRNDLAELYWAIKDYTRAEQLLRDVLDIQERTLGINHPDLSRPLGKLIELCYLTEHYEQAEPLVARLLPIIEKAQSVGRAAADLSLSSIGGLYLPKEEYGKFEQLLLQTLSVKEQIAGKESLELINLLSWLAKLYTATASYAKAEQYLLRAQAILENHPDSEPKKAAYVFNALGTLHYLKSDYPDAEKFLLRAVKLFQQTSDGERQDDLAWALNNLGLLYYTKGEFAEAERHFQNARQLMEKAFGPGDARVGILLNHLALLYYTRGNYEKAKLFFTNALNILRNKLGAKHPDLAYSYSNLGTLYCQQGDYVEAERLLSLALSIREDVVGTEHPELTPILNNLAVLFASKGDYQNAERHLKRAIAIEEKILGVDNINVGKFLTQLAAFYISNDEDEKARQPLERSLAIFEKTVGTEHRDVALTRMILGVLYINSRDYKRAKAELEHALTILQKSEPDSLYVAVILSHLAEISYAKKEYVEAESQLQNALADMQQALGPHQPDTATILHNLAGVNESQDRIDRAIDFTTRANSISEYNLLRNIIAGSERQKILYLNKLSDELDHTISLHVRSAPHNTLARRLALTTLLQRKGRALDVMTDSIGALRRIAVQDPDLHRAFDLLLDARSQYAAMVFEPGEVELAQYQAKLEDLERKINEMERDISVRSVEFRIQSQPVTLDAVQTAIPQDAALIEFLFYYPFDSKAGEWDSPRYVAYILRSHGTPEWVDLGSAKAIHSEVNKFRGSLRGNQSDIRQRARALDALVMLPVRNRLDRFDKNIRRLFISPDAELSLFPFAALIDETNHYLIENYSITYLTCGRDLLRLRNSLPSKQGPLIVANPNFNLEQKPDGSEMQAAQTLAGRRRSREALDYFSPLDEADTEALALRRVLKDASVLSGDQATEASVKQVHGPRILHLITHGFFQENQKRIGKNLRETMWGSNTSPSAIALNENPLLRSGLALAGANLLQNGSTEDGILTALEAAGLDLWGTRLVVLSACETGLGDVENGEGVFGLRRALVLAGAESQVMSLWKVNDEATRVLMVKYYQRLMSGEGRGEALRQVQLEMLSEAKYSQPYFWASFVESGNWRNLDNQ